ncbi:MAG: hypothetical protein P1P84_24375 [Deferrisomatales bacterium]|nr:hypothetical protein [Deferrisomatales bacterium]
MTLALLVAISVMWIPVALLFLGKGEAKGTGAVTAVVGAVVVVGAMLQAAIFKDAFTAGLLFAHGILYCTVAFALLTGLEDMRSVGNVSLTVAVVSAVYMVLFYTGGTGPGGAVLVGKSNYFAFACAGYVGLTLEVWLNAYGKLSATLLAWSLIAWAFVGLYVPAFSLMAYGTLPF